MPQPTRPASVRIMQYWPLRQRLLMPMAQPFLNWSGREIDRGRGSVMGILRSLGPALEWPHRAGYHRAAREARETPARLRVLSRRPTGRLLLDEARATR